MESISFHLFVYLILCMYAILSLYYGCASLFLSLSLYHSFIHLILFSFRLVFIFKHYTYRHRANSPNVPSNAALSLSLNSHSISIFHIFTPSSFLVFGVFFSLRFPFILTFVTFYFCSAWKRLYALFSRYFFFCLVFLIRSCRHCQYIQRQTRLRCTHSSQEKNQNDKRNRKYLKNHYRFIHYHFPTQKKLQPNEELKCTTVFRSAAAAATSARWD